MRKSFLGAGAWLLLSAIAAGAASPDQLYQTWQKNYIRDPDIAEKAAEDYLHAAPQGDHAQDLHLWLDAYHKAVADLMSQSRKSASANKQPAAPPPKQAAAPPAAAPIVKQAAMPPPPPPKQVATPPVAIKQAVLPPPKQAAAPLPKLVQAAPSQPAVPPFRPPAPPPVPAKQPEAKPPGTRMASALPQANAAPGLAKEIPKEPPKEALQEASVPSPRARPAGQSLDDLLAFIADKVEGQGSLTFTAEFLNPAGGALTERLSYQASNVTIDPNRCQVSWRWHVQQDGKPTPDQDRAVQLRLSKSIGVETIGQALGDLNARHFRVHVYPGAYAVHIAHWDTSAGDNLYFRDKAMAESVAGAARHALELCDKRGR